MANQASYIETNCVIEHEGRKFESGGAIVSEQFVIAYLGKAEGPLPYAELAGSKGTLTDWHGNVIGTYRILSTWRTPRSFVSGTMSSVECFVNGVRYVGRSGGVGMSIRAKRSPRQ